ncbi:MAG: UPF0149 family protein [Alteromonadaceae bacterium]|nr:UPF0149 family protein [Alteromonadaceae bacterium]
MTLKQYKNVENSVSFSSLSDLRQFYSNSDATDIVHPPAYVHGLIFSVCASPEIPMPEKWFPWVVKNQGVIDSKQIDLLSDILMKMLQEQLSAMRDEKVQFPSEFQFAADADAHQQWMRGLVYGHGLMEKTWSNAWELMMQKAPERSNEFHSNLTRCLRMFTTFADPQLAVQQAEQRGVSDFAQKLPQLAESMSVILLDYVKLSGELVEFIPNQFEVYQDELPKFN